MSDKLKGLSNEELWKLFPIVLKPHNPQYRQWYLDEKKHLIDLIGKDSIVRINHIGSTSVHGLIAKPTIDILIEVDCEEDVTKVKDSLDGDIYICKEQKDAFNHKSLICMKGYSEQGFLDKVFHIHVKVYNNHNELYFRDYLQDHPDIALAYGELKISLLKKYQFHRDHYTESKSDFINRYTEFAKMIYPNRYKPKN